MSRSLFRVGCVAVVAAVWCAAALPAGAQDRNTVTGYVTSLTVDDLTFTRGISRAEGRYVVRVALDSTPGVVLGFGEPGKPLAGQREMLDLLMKALENRWQVSLRLRREVSSDGDRSHARIVSVAVRP